jgi:outer membrane protein OmpA-like peptidoglycan-associated protein
MRLSDAVAKALRMRGVPDSQLQVEGLGKEFPVTSNNSPEGRQQNRRVEIVFSD